MSNQNQYKFTEGEIHRFKITGFTEIPYTDESFYVLENKFGGKHLLKSLHYKNYGLYIDQELNCKIDKINCSGKIYLEPENPWYKEGEVYNFKFVKLIEHINSVGEKEKAAVVIDQSGTEVLCSIPKDCKLSENIKNLRCRVLRIKKGELYLSIPEKSNRELLIGEKYCFDVTEIKPLENKVEHYILKDDSGCLYSLKKDMYKHYGFEIGQNVECTVTKFNTDGHLKIEPVHPYYEIGKIYTFEFIKTEKELTPLGKEEYVIEVKDIYGVETKVRSVDFNKVPDPITDKITCKVEGIRKGKAILSLVY